jgi:hypothetical protein
VANGKATNGHHFSFENVVIILWQHRIDCRLPRYGKGPFGARTPKLIDWLICSMINALLPHVVVALFWTKMVMYSHLSREWINLAWKGLTVTGLRELWDFPTNISVIKITIPIIKLIISLYCAFRELSSKWLCHQVLTIMKFLGQFLHLFIAMAIGISISPERVLNAPTHKSLQLKPTWTSAGSCLPKFKKFWYFFESS